MNVTEVLVDLVDQHARLKAFCSVTFDHVFVVHSIRLVEIEGRLVVCMPNRKRTLGCVSCRKQVPITDRHCGHCSGAQPTYQDRLERCRQELNDPGTKVREFIDLCHPIDRHWRKDMEDIVLDAYRKKLQEAEDGSPPTGAAGHDAR